MLATAFLIEPYDLAPLSVRVYIAFSACDHAHAQAHAMLLCHVHAGTYSHTHTHKANTTYAVSYKFIAHNGQHK